MKIIGVFALLLTLSSFTLLVRDVQAAVAGPELTPAYQSQEGEEKKEDEEPDCE